MSMGLDSRCTETFAVNLGYGGERQDAESVVDEKNGTPAGPDTVQSSVFPCTPPYPPAALQMYFHCEMSDGCETDICGIYFETAMRTVEPLLARGSAPI